MNKKYIFIISNIHLPRCVNRVKEFHKKGYEVEVYYFDRTIFNNKVGQLDVWLWFLFQKNAQAIFHY